MARSSQVTVENNFTKGLVTEATAMSFPENSVVEIDNCDISTRGVVTRRLGIDYEPNYQLLELGAITPNVGAINEFVWNTVSDNNEVEFIVQQVANKIIFFESSPDGLSSRLKSFDIDLLTYKVTAWIDELVYKTPCSFAAGSGYLYITNAYCEPLIVEYDLTSDSIDTTIISVEIRDFDGVNDGLAVDNQPLTLSAMHEYNLKNQGWYSSSITVSGVGGVQVLDYYFTSLSSYPSNADVWWYLKDTTGYYNPTNNFAGLPKAEAPKGHYVFNAFNVNRSTVVATVTDTTTNSRPSSVAFYAGRVFYSGVKDKNYSASVYFSRVTRTPLDVGKCYQNNDPTTEGISEVLADDGGVIKIAEASNIVRIVAANNVILVLASNGVWTISGSANEPFSPTNYVVTKINDIGAISALSTCSVEGVPIWINYEGMFTIQMDKVSGSPSVVSITQDTIQGYFDRIPKENLEFVKGVYNSSEKRIMWLYRLAARVDEIDKYQYDNVLVLNRLTGAFYNYSFALSSVPRLSGIVSVLGRNEENRLTYVFKFTTIGDFYTAGANGITYSQIIDESLNDWTSNSPVIYSSYFITGYRVRGELLKKFQSNYLMVLTSDASSGSCLVQGLWDYTNTTDNGRYTSSQEIYRPDSTYNYHRCKLKIRGNGYSLQFKFRSNGNSPFEIIGWSTFETANNIP